MKFIIAAVLGYVLFCSVLFCGGGGYSEESLCAFSVCILSTTSSVCTTCLYLQMPTNRVIFLLPFFYVFLDHSSPSAECSLALPQMSSALLLTSLWLLSTSTSSSPTGAQAHCICHTIYPATLLVAVYLVLRLSPVLFLCFSHSHSIADGLTWCHHCLSCVSFCWTCHSLGYHAHVSFISHLQSSICLLVT